MEQGIFRGLFPPFLKQNPKALKSLTFALLQQQCAQQNSSHLAAVHSRRPLKKQLLRNRNCFKFGASLVYDYLVGRDEELVPFHARQLWQLLCVFSCCTLLLSSKQASCRRRGRSI